MCTIEAEVSVLGKVTEAVNVPLAGTVEPCAGEEIVADGGGCSSQPTP
jgi:hypothetical protein